jgi:hypothetical protein
MRLGIRILIAVFALAGAVAWSLLLIWLLYLGQSLAGMGDGAGGGSKASPLALLLIVAIWLLPTAAFIFMLLSSLNILKGALRHIGYWYALFFLIIATGALMVLYPSLRVLKLIGLVFMLVTGLWGFAFRENGPLSAKENPKNIEGA